MNKSSIFKFLAVIFGVFLTAGCDKEFHSVGIDLLENSIFEMESETYPLYLFQNQLERVQTNGLPLAMLGTYSHPVFGKTEATITSQLQINPAYVFGNFSQQREDAGDPDNVKVIDENETVTDVFLEIPFFNNQRDSDSDGVIDIRDSDPNDPASDSDGDGISDILESQTGTNPLSVDSDNDGVNDAEDTDNSSYDIEANVYEIDSLYGDYQEPFTLKVQQLNYFLSQLDPEEDFTTARPYFNDTDYLLEGFGGDILFDQSYQLNLEELVFFYDEDDPDTEENETTLVEERLTPRIRVPLDTDFFQKNILDKEGEEVLNNLAKFQSYFKGLIIQATSNNDNLMMLLDINNALIKMNFDFQRYDDGGTSEDLDDDIIMTENRTYTLNLAPVRFNTIRTENQDSSINQSFLNGFQEQPSEKIYIKGGNLFAKLNLFGNTEAEQREAILPYKNERRLINAAKLRLYLSDFHSNNGNLYVPERLYLYLNSSGEPLPDYNADNTTANGVTNGDKYVFGGLLQYDAADRPSHYEFNITENITTIMGKASFEDGALTLSDYDNFSLGLVLGANIQYINLFEGHLPEGRGVIKYPLTGTLNPFGVELLGNASGLKAAELEIIYNTTR